MAGPSNRVGLGLVAVVVANVRQLQKSKKTGTSNWASPRLSERQMLYAANDAHVVLRLYREWLCSGASLPAS